MFCVMFLHFTCVLQPHSLQWLVRHDYPVKEWASFRPFFKCHHIPPKFLTCDRLLPTHALSLEELTSLLHERVYSLGQGEWEVAETGSVTRCFIPSVQDRDSYPLKLNFFLSQALIEHVCFQEYIFFPLSPLHSSILLLPWESSNYLPYPVLLPDFDVLRRVFKVTPNALPLSSPFLKFAEMAIQRLWRAEQLLRRHGRR